jgi:glycosyltransferase involved in cell wall biosynthesis
MKIALDASNLRGGGGVSHLIELLKAADPARDAFDHITVFGPSATLEQLSSHVEWLTLVDHPWLNRSLPFRTAWRRLILPSLLQGRFDILFSPGGILAPTALPRVTMCRNMLPFDKVEKARYRLSAERARIEILRKLQSRAFAEADGVIFLTEFAKSSVLDQIPQLPKSCTVVPHGIASRFSSAARDVRRFEECSTANPFRLLYVSSVNRYKHQWHVVAAVAALQAEGLPISLDLVGGGETESITRLENELKRYPDADITYHGKINFDEIHRHYHRADGFIFASTCENMPNILLEAMAAGLPILCSDRGPMPEVLGDDGFYADPENPERLAEALKEFLNDPDRRLASSAAAQRRAAEFTVDLCAERSFAYLRDIHQAHRDGKP